MTRPPEDYRNFVRRDWLTSSGHGPSEAFVEKDGEQGPGRVWWTGQSLALVLADALWRSKADPRHRIELAVRARRGSTLLTSAV